MVFERSIYIYALGFWFAILFLVILRLVLTQRFFKLINDLNTHKPDLTQETLSNSLFLVIGSVSLIVFLFQTLLNSFKLIDTPTYLLYPYLIVLPLLHIVIYFCLVFVMVTTGKKLAYGLVASSFSDRISLLITVATMIFAVLIGIISTSCL